ncbi:hypothetical protein O5D80_007682 [Batrachochytrium dendrobatidis]|nr:hypothetical protein O5D80_007682 [Batrachochytrium dendrobatidis]
MPIVVKDYSVSQNDTELFISVPLSGTSASKVDVYCNDVYIKINFPPFFFELDLENTIDSQASIASVGNGMVVFTLVKTHPGIWNTVKFQAESPKALRDRRAAGEERERHLAIKKREEAIALKRSEERDMVRRQIEVERAKRERVEALKQAEKKAGENEVNSWAQSTLAVQRDLKIQATVHAKQESEKMASIATKSEIAFREDSAIFGVDDVAVNIQSSDDLDSHDIDEESADDDIDVEAIRAKVRAQLKARVQPPPRACQDIQVKFTPRGHIPTNTARETEDEKWRIRIKLAEALQKSKTNQACESNQQSDDRNSAFLKDKGIEFFKQGNIESALNAFTAAIDLDPLSANLYANRAACFLHLSNATDCISDCTIALGLISKEEDLLKEQLVDPVAYDQETGNQRRRLKVKLLVRRGTARSNLVGDIKRGLADYQDALKLDPENPDLETDIAALKERLGDAAITND